MLIKDILEFNRKKYFGGAVQANWFYDNDMAADIASSYVFHGPKYHGVGETDHNDLRYKLYDTASYAHILFRKAYDDTNRFNMTIAGYGTGKSHLSVALASLLSGHDEQLRQCVITSISKVDINIGSVINKYQDKNLVLVLNGMRDFNLNSEVLAVAKKALAQHGIAGEVFSEITKHYSVAINFVRNTFEDKIQLYRNAFDAHSCTELFSADDVIRELENANSSVFYAVNDVYKSFVGTDIPIEAGISAADVLELLVNKFCVEQNVFRSIYILFDEFGRYIEFTAREPQIAGDSALQQIFEAVQNANGKIIFDAFIQSDLNAYLSRVESSSNIIRYVGRYENSEKYYLSSNFETVLANLIEKKDPRKFAATVEYNIDSVYARFHQNVFNSLNSWAKPEIAERSVWSNSRMYFDVIAKGCYPLHPITVWFLANTSSWMQQRSTISYTAELFDVIKDRDVSTTWLPYIYPADIIGTGLFDEMQNSEEKSLVQSQNCLSYQSIMVKHGDKFDENEIRVLRAVLITNIIKFKFYDRNSCQTALKYCSGLNDEAVEKAIEQLENEFCVISLDESTNRFTLNAEAHGKREFNLAIMKKQSQLRNYDPIQETDEELVRMIGLNQLIETPFGTKNNIVAAEWCYDVRLIRIEQVNDSYLQSLKSYFTKAVDGDTPRGIVVYTYCSPNADRAISAAAGCIIAHNIKQYPVVFLLLVDEENKWLNYLKRRAVFRMFNQSEIDMFARFISDDMKRANREIVNLFKRMTLKRLLLTEKGMESYPSKLKDLYYERFEEVYKSAIPFAFDGFEKKSTPSVRKTLLEMCQKMYGGTMCNKQAFQGIDPKMKNRIQAVLTVDIPTSWQVFNGKYELCEPKNPKVRKIYRGVMEKIKTGAIVSLGDLFKDLLYAPYGMNYNSLLLFVVYVLSINSRTIEIHEGGYVLSKAQFIDKYLSNEKRALDNILKLKISIKTQTDDEIIEGLISEIKQMVYVEYCQEYKKRLDKVCSDPDIEQRYGGEVAVAKLTLSEASKINRRLYDQLNKYETDIENSTQKFNLVKVVGTLSGIERRQKDAFIDEDDGTFCYSDVYCSRVDKLLKTAEELLDSNFYSFIASLSCTYDQSSEFKKRYAKVCKDLQAMKHTEYAKALKQRVSDVVTEAELRQKYATALTEADQFITFTRNTVGTMDSETCGHKQVETESWKQFFSNANDLKEETRAKYDSELSGLIELLIKRQEEIEVYAANLVEELSDPTCSLPELKEKIDICLKIKPSEKYSRVLVSASNLLDEFKRVSSSIQSNNIAQSINKLKLEYETRWKGTVCEKFMKDKISEAEQTLERMRNGWMNRFVYSVVSRLSEMTLGQCQQWRTSVGEIPDYLSEDNLREFAQLSEKITEKLKIYKINGVVELYKSLNSDEKKRCLEILRGIE